jgi:hypothetical protein
VSAPPPSPSQCCERRVGTILGRARQLATALSVYPTIWLSSGSLPQWS